MVRNLSTNKIRLMKKKYVIPDVVCYHVVSEHMVATSVRSNLDDLEMGGNASDYGIDEADANATRDWELW